MDNKQTGEKRGVFSGVRRSFECEIARRRSERRVLVTDIALFAVALFFARRHIAFGAYPLAGAFLAVIPVGVWVALAGAAVGALTLGRIGVVFAINSIVTVLLRIIISGGKREEDSPLFSEPYVMRVAAGAIGALISSVYNIIFEGITFSSVLLAVFSILFTVLLELGFYGLFAYGVSFEEILFGTRNIFIRTESEREKWSMRAFACGVLVFFFLISFSLSDYGFFGISPAYIFSGALSLFVARRFGAVRAMACGFIAALAVSPMGAVAFALVGLGAGALFGIGYGYAVIGGGALLSVWCAYSGGVSLFLSVFSEYLISVVISYPFLKDVKREHTKEQSESVSKIAEEMVLARAGSYKCEDAEISELEDAIGLASVAIKEYGEDDGRGDFEDYRSIVSSTVSQYTSDPCEENIDILATKLYKKQRIYASDIERLLPMVKSSERFLYEICRLSGEYEREFFERRKMDAVAKEYELISKMINEARMRRSDAGTCNRKMSERLGEVFLAAGLTDGMVKAYGRRRMRIIGAAEDREGNKITSPELKRAIEEATGARLGEFEFFKKGDVAMLVASSIPKLRVEYATVSSTSKRSEVSGDTAIFFEHNGVFSSLISDGMGSGRVAERTSKFVTRFLSEMPGCEENIDSYLSAVNHLIRHRGEECSATVDLFSLDLITGEAFFIKCGAAPSFLKRSSSLFRIKSATAPIGLMKEVDSEKIKVEVGVGDYAIMLSDGAVLLPDDAVWLFEFLSRPSSDSAEVYAERILSEAKKNSDADDDITVSVVRILAKD